MLKNIRIVLVETTHPGNIGATARAMKNMGLTRLSLVKPQRYPSHEATARAAGADDVLAPNTKPQPSRAWSRESQSCAAASTSSAPAARAVAS